MLTEQEAKCIGYLGDFLEHEGHAPSYHQIAVAIGATARSTAHKIIHQLEEKGLVIQPPNRRRALNLTEEGWVWARRNNPEEKKQ